MGKRSEFVRTERDFYPTPLKAAQPLFPHLAPQTRFIEPCAGDGRLTRYLVAAEHVCVYQCDLLPMRHDIDQADALAIEDTGQRARGIVFITNPPWLRSQLHPLIDHLSNIAPTWLLFDADWVHTKQSAPFMDRLVSIVSVGRVKWIEATKHTGKDNCAWHLFDSAHTGPAEFHGMTAA